MNVVVVARDPSRRRMLIRQAEQSGWTVQADAATEASLSADDLDDVTAVVLDARDVRNADAPVTVAAAEDLIEPLTTREREVLEQLAVGLSNHQIAQALGISDHTVKFHVGAIFSKLGVSSRAAAIRHGVKHGLVTI